MRHMELPEQQAIAAGMNLIFPTLAEMLLLLERMLFSSFRLFKMEMLVPRDRREISVRRDHKVMLAHRVM